MEFYEITMNSLSLYNGDSTLPLNSYLRYLKYNIFMKNINMFNQIVNNMFESLSKSLDNIDKDPKASIIFYYSALELLFKARLMHEHWAFILEDLDGKTASYQNFINGDFKTVTLETAAKRIRNILRDLEENYEKHFEKLNNTRNKLIHFDSFSEKDNNLSKEAISESWYYVYELLNKKWNNIFKEHSEKINELNYKFKIHSTHFFKSKRKVLVERNKEKYIHNPQYEIIKIANKPIECEHCCLSHFVIDKDTSISLLKSLYNEDNPFVELVCDICNTEISISELYIKINKNIIVEDIQNSVREFLDNYTRSPNIKRNSLHEQLLLSSDKSAVLETVKDYLEDNEDIELQSSFNNQEAKFKIEPMYIDFTIQSPDGITAFYYLIIEIELNCNKNEKEIKKAKFEEIYNSIISYNINIDIDSDGF